MPRPSIVLVVLDDIAAVDLTPARAPNYFDLLALGREHVNAYSMPVCSQSRACLVFGTYGRHLGITEAMSASDGPEPAAGTATLASLLRASGYYTAMVGKWHLGRHPTAFTAIGAPLGRGYDRWLAGTADNISDYFSWERFEDSAPPVTEATYATIAQVGSARSWWESTQHPRFLHLALSTPHGPFHEPPAELLGGYEPEPGLTPNRRRYEKMIRAADWALGELRTFTGIQHALVCVVGDNGTPMNVPGPGQNPERLKTTTYEDGIRVPMAWYGPSVGIAPGSKEYGLSHLVDVPARMLVAAGVGVPAGWGGMTIPRSSAISEATLADGTLERAAISGDLVKLRRTGDEPEELYDLQNDPVEAINLIDDPEWQTELALLREDLYGVGLA
jgi:arylsulfatase A-like enzyme